MLADLLGLSDSSGAKTVDRVLGAAFLITAVPWAVLGLRGALVAAWRSPRERLSAAGLALGVTAALVLLAARVT